MPRVCARPQLVKGIVFCFLISRKALSVAGQRIKNIMLDKEEGDWEDSRFCFVSKTNM